MGVGFIVVVLLFVRIVRMVFFLYLFLVMLLWMNLFCRDILDIFMIVGSCYLLLCFWWVCFWFEIVFEWFYWYVYFGSGNVRFDGFILVGVMFGYEMRWFIL